MTRLRQGAPGGSELGEDQKSLEGAPDPLSVPANGSLTPARTAPIDTEKTISEICDLMARSEWGRKSGKAMALRLGCSYSYIRQLAGKATQRRHPDVELIELKRQEYADELEHVAKRALAGKGMTRDADGGLVPIDPDFKASVAAYKTAAEVTGVIGQRGATTVNLLVDARGNPHPEAKRFADEALREKLAMRAAFETAIFEECDEAKAERILDRVAAIVAGDGAITVEES